MARVTVEDCIVKVSNRFDLVMIASQRHRQLDAGAALTIERDNDRNPVVALREIAEGTVDIEKLKEAALNSLRQHIHPETSEELAQHLLEETQSHQDFTPELSLTGELDEEEAALEAEFSEIEKHINVDVDLETTLEEVISEEEQP